MKMKMKITFLLPQKDSTQASQLAERPARAQGLARPEALRLRVLSTRPQQSLAAPPRLASAIHPPLRLGAGGALRRSQPATRRPSERIRSYQALPGNSTISRSAEPPLATDLHNLSQTGAPGRAWRSGQVPAPQGTRGAQALLGPRQPAGRAVAWHAKEPHENKRGDCATQQHPARNSQSWSQQPDSPISLAQSHRH